MIKNVSDRNIWPKDISFSKYIYNSIFYNLPISDKNTSWYSKSILNPSLYDLQ